MKALMLAAGVGKRLGNTDALPKSLLDFAGRSLLARHIDILRASGIEGLELAVGYRDDAIRAEIEVCGHADFVRATLNPDYERGSMVSLWTLRDALTAGEDVLLMDADVLYDQRMIRALTDTTVANCFLLDRDIEPGEEPVKLCVRGDRLVEFRKQVAPDLAYDFHGESVGFFRLSGDMAARLADRTQDYVDRGLLDEHYEEAIRDLLLENGGAEFGFEDVTGLPWIEIDFPEDIARAEAEVLARLKPLP